MDLALDKAKFVVMKTKAKRVQFLGKVVMRNIPKITA